MKKILAPNTPTRGTKSTEKSGRAISRPKLTHQWYEDHRNEQEDHFGTRGAMILARSQKGNGHGVRRQIAVSKQRSRECRDLGLKSTDVDPRRLCASAEGRISTQLEHLEPRLKSNAIPKKIKCPNPPTRGTSADSNRCVDSRRPT